jgi:hypothetical protein
VGLDVGVGMRVPVVSGTSVGQLVPFCGVNVSSGVTGVATGQVVVSGFWWFGFPTIPLGRDVSGSPPSAEIGEAVNVVILFVIVVSKHMSPRDGAFFGKYGIEAVDFGCEFSFARRCDSTHRAGGSEFAGLSHEIALCFAECSEFRGVVSESLGSEIGWVIGVGDHLAVRLGDTCGVGVINPIFSCDNK